MESKSYSALNVSRIVQRAVLISALSIVVLIATACDGGTGSSDLSDSERQDIAAEIEDRNRDLLEVWSHEDAFDEWMELYVDESHEAWADDPFMLTVSGNTFESRDEM